MRGKAVLGGHPSDRPHFFSASSATKEVVIAAGATCLIVDVAKLRPTVLAADLVLGRDRHARRYAEAYRSRKKQ